MVPFRAISARSDGPVGCEHGNSTRTSTQVLIVTLILVLAPKWPLDELEQVLDLVRAAHLACPKMHTLIYDESLSTKPLTIPRPYHFASHPAPAL